MKQTMCEKLATPSQGELERDMSGEEERGIRMPIVRIPDGKTRLSSVLLKSNPWEKRDLERKLRHLHTQNGRRLKNLDWNQRKFFISKVFDHESKLRFPSSAREYYTADSSEERSNHNQTCIDETDSQTGKREIYNRFNSLTRRKEDLNDTRGHNKGTNITVNKLPTLHTSKIQDGIFSVPSKMKGISKHAGEQKKRELNELRLPQISSFRHTDRPTSSISLPPLLNNRSTKLQKEDAVDNEGTRIPIQIDINKASHKLRSFTTLDISPSNQGVESYKANKNETYNELRLPMIENLPPQCELDKDREYVEDGSSSLCDVNIINRLTKTLPADLMVRANEITNRTIVKRNEQLLLKSKRISTMDALKDPRWKLLQQTLEPNQKSPLHFT